jgi:hypothetical protein
VELSPDRTDAPLVPAISQSSKACDQKISGFATDQACSSRKFLIPFRSISDFSNIFQSVAGLIPLAQMITRKRITGQIEEENPRRSEGFLYPKVE